LAVALAVGAAKTAVNPMYPGLLLLLMRWAVQKASTWALAGPPGFMRRIDRFLPAPEDRVLTRMLGDRYTEYKSRVCHWH
jgi:protein-S-isoprenylcysteine O-methyltransferase Ste14